MVASSSRRVTHIAFAVAVALLFVVSSALVNPVAAAPTTITAYKSQIAVNVNSPYSASSWTDTPTTTDATSGVTFAVKENGTGFLFFLEWQTSAAVCSDTSCYGGIELGPVANTAVMGSSSSPTLMILAAPVFKGEVGSYVDEFISTGLQTPTAVESANGKTQTVCGSLVLASSTYTIQCYRPFALKGASSQDFTSATPLGVGSTVELGFAVGEFNSPGTHDATAMNVYQLTFSASTYGTTTGSSSSSSAASSSSSSNSTTAPSSSSSSSTPTTSTTQSTTSSTAPTSSSSASTFTAYKSQLAVNVKAAYVASQWSDTVTTTEPTSGMTVAFKQNTTGLIFLMQWSTSNDCSNAACYGGIELGPSTNTAPMGSTGTPTTMILASSSFPGSVNEFISTGTFTPPSVTASGYAVQTTCGLTVTGTTYTAICYRPFSGANASPAEVTLAVGSTLELGFAVGEFNQPGTHAATDMQSYTLLISGSDLPSGVSTTQTVTPPPATGDGFPGLNVTTLFIIGAVALLVGVVLGIGVSVRAKKAAGK